LFACGLVALVEIVEQFVDFLLRLLLPIKGFDLLFADLLA
jgi:hypothetical protein